LSSSLPPNNNNVDGDAEGFETKDESDLEADADEFLLNPNEDADGDTDESNLKPTPTPMSFCSTQMETPTSPI
jgi:hypothetical protein